MTKKNKSRRRSPNVRLCDAHPKYKGLRQPRTLCRACWFAYVDNERFAFLEQR